MGVVLVLALEIGEVFVECGFKVDGEHIFFLLNNVLFDLPQLDPQFPLQRREFGILERAQKRLNHCIYVACVPEVGDACAGLLLECLV